MAKLPGFFWLIIALGLIVLIFNMGGVAKISSLLTRTASSSVTSRGSVGTSSSLSFFSWFGPPSIPSASSVFHGGPSGQSYTNQYNQYHNPYGNQYGNTNSGGGNNGSQISSYDIPSGFTRSELSPYFHKIRFGGVSQQQISLVTSYYGATTTVDITGWEIKTNRSGEYIPQAANIYDPAGSPWLSDIILTLNRGQYVNVYSNSAPVNLRLNKCLGYLNQPNQFNPPFPYSCPAVDRSTIANFTGACQNYIQSLGNCQSPDFGSPYFPRNDYQCEQYLTNNFNYRSCVTNHRADSDFLGNEWRIWMGGSPLDRYHDTVELLDGNGLLVDFYQY